MPSEFPPEIVQRMKIFDVWSKEVKALVNQAKPVVVEIKKKTILRNFLLFEDEMAYLRRAFQENLDPTSPSIPPPVLTTYILPLERIGEASLLLKEMKNLGADVKTLERTLSEKVTAIRELTDDNEEKMNVGVSITFRALLAQCLRIVSVAEKSMDLSKGEFERNLSSYDLHDFLTSSISEMESALTGLKEIGRDWSLSETESNAQEMLERVRDLLPMILRKYEIPFGGSLLDFEHFHRSFWWERAFLEVG